MSRLGLFIKRTYYLGALILGLIIVFILSYLAWPYLHFKVSSSLDQLRFAEQYRQQPEVVSARYLNAFLTIHSQGPLSDKVRKQYLYSLASKRRWSDVVRWYQPGLGAGMNCLNLQARYNLGERESLWPQVTQLWSVKYSQSALCNPIFKVWMNADQLTDELIWLRLMKVIPTHNDSLSRYLIGLLQDESLHVLSKQWMQLKKNSNSLMHFKSGEHPIYASMLSQALILQAHQDVEKSVQVWELIKEQHAFDQGHHYAIYSAFSTHLAKKNDKKAKQWLEKIPSKHWDQALLMSHLALALHHTQWSEIIRLSELFSQHKKLPLIWHYWKARAYEQLNQEEKAAIIYTQLSNEQHYYGFLAQQRLGLNLKVQTHRLEYQEVLWEQFKNHPLVQQLRRDQWHHFVSGLSRLEQYFAARVADARGWCDLSMRLLQQTHFKKMVTLRFPMKYLTLVMQKAHERALNPALLFAMIRQESAFQAHAKSHAGAVGLMQLLPSTAADIAQRAGYKKIAAHDLVNAKINLGLGSYYISQLKKHLKHPIAALAAYNAGPGRVARWLSERPMGAMDLWIETLPWEETKHYVKNVLSAIPIYQYHLGQSPNLTPFFVPIGSRFSP